MRVQQYAVCAFASVLAILAAGCAQSVVATPPASANAWTTPAPGAPLYAQPRLQLSRAPTRAPAPCPPSVVAPRSVAAPPRVEPPCPDPAPAPRNLGAAAIESRPPCTAPPDPATIRVQDTASNFAQNFGGYVSYVGPDYLDLGVFYRVNPVVSVGMVGRQDFETDTLPDVGQPGRPTADNLLDFDDKSAFSFGPALSITLQQETRTSPSLKLFASAYEFGSADAEKLRTVALIGGKRFPIGRSANSGLARSFGVNVGAGYWSRDFSSGIEDTSGFVGWVRGDVQLFRGFGAWAEISTQTNHCDGAYTIGLQWVSNFGVTFSISYYDCFAGRTISGTPNSAGAFGGQGKPTRSARETGGGSGGVNSSESPRAEDDNGEEEVSAWQVFDE